MIINKTELQIEKKKGKYGIEYSPASASDGPLIAGGPTLNMEFPHLRFSFLTSDHMPATKYTVNTSDSV